MKYYYALSEALIGVSIVLVQPQVTNAALSPEQVGEIAQGITVLIETTDKKDNGSGVIIQKQGNTYTVLTAAHVVRSSNKYEIVTPDKQRYQLDYSSVKKLPNQIDLAVVTFTSSNNYQVAKVGNSDRAKLGSKVYVAGFPKQKGARKFTSISLSPPGQITANATQAVDGGYSLSYNVATLPGMSGGALLNQQGELIAIHGRGEAANVNDIVFDKLNPEVAYIKGNNNYAIPIYTFLRQASLVGVNLKITVPPLQVAQAPTAEDFYLKGVDNAQKGDYQGAIFQFTQAINNNPNYAEAYYNRGNARLVLENNQQAINDFEQATKINPNYIDAYLSKRDAHAKLSPTGRKIADQTQAMLAEQRAFKLLMEQIKNDPALRQKFITELRRRATDNKNSFN